MESGLARRSHVQTDRLSLVGGNEHWGGSVGTTCCVCGWVCMSPRSRVVMTEGAVQMKEVSKKNTSCVWVRACAC